MFAMSAKARVRKLLDLSRAIARLLKLCEVEFFRSPLMFEKFLEVFDHFRIFTSPTKDHDNTTAALHWCLGISGNFDQLMRDLRVVGISKRVDDLGLDVFVLLGIVEVHELVDRCFTSTTTKRADCLLAQFRVIRAPGNLEQFGCGAFTLTPSEAPNYRLADFKILAGIVNLKQSIHRRLALAASDTCNCGLAQRQRLIAHRDVG